MDIDWYGHSCFRLRERNIAIITDPYSKSIGYSLPRLRADVVTVSHDAPGHANADAIKGDPKVVNRPGEYEIKSVFVTGLQTCCGSRSGDERSEDNTVFTFEFGGLTICHLGDLSKTLTQSQVESLPSVDILLTPVGGGGGLDADKASQMISMLEPRIVIPMHYHTTGLTVELEPLDKFLKTMGVTDQAPQESLRVSQASLPEETLVTILERKQS